MIFFCCFCPAWGTFLDPFKAPWRGKRFALGGPTCHQAQLAGALMPVERWEGAPRREQADVRAQAPKQFSSQEDPRPGSGCLKGRRLLPVRQNPTLHGYGGTVPYHPACMAFLAQASLGHVDLVVTSWLGASARWSLAFSEWDTTLGALNWERSRQ